MDHDETRIASLIKDNWRSKKYRYRFGDRTQELVLALPNFIPDFVADMVPYPFESRQRSQRHQTHSERQSHSVSSPVRGKQEPSVGNYKRKRHPLHPLDELLTRNDFGCFLVTLHPVMKLNGIRVDFALESNRVLPVSPGKICK